MRPLFTVLCATTLLAGTVSITRAADEKSQVQGELIDTYCYSSGGASGAGHKDCAEKCAKSGIPVGVLVDGKAWTLATNPMPLAKYMADTVRVTGQINKEAGVVVPDKIEVKDGDNWKEVKLSDAHHGGDEK